MEGIVVNFRGGLHTQYSNQLIVKIDGINTKEEADKLAKKSAVFITTSGKEIKGTITKSHGNKGAVRVRFEKGLPGQSIGKKVKIL